MTNDLDHSERSLQNWEACQSGELSQMASRLKTRRRVRSMGGQFAVVVALGMLLGGGLFMFSSSEPKTLTCHQVDDYLSENDSPEKFKTLDQDVRKQIEHHVANCDRCHKWHSKNIEELIIASLRAIVPDWILLAFNDGVAGEQRRP